MEIEHFVVLSPAILISIGIILRMIWVMSRKFAADRAFLVVLKDAYIGASWMGATFGAIFGLKNYPFEMYLLVILWWLGMFSLAVGVSQRLERMDELRAQDLNFRSATKRRRMKGWKQ